MTNQHPITPPPELVQQWLGTYFGTTVTGEVSEIELALATAAARWGADQELLACGSYLEKCASWEPEDVTELLNRRRPRPPSLKEEALIALHAVATGANDTREQHQDLDTIRKALEQLND